MASQPRWPVALFSNNESLRHGYEVSPYGKQILILNSEVIKTGPKLTSLVVVENWFDELERLVPPDQI